MTGTTSGDDKLNEIRKRHDSGAVGLFVRDMKSYRGCDAQARKDHFNTTYEERGNGNLGRALNEWKGHYHHLTLKKMQTRQKEFDSPLSAVLQDEDYPFNYFVVWTREKFDKTWTAESKFEDIVSDCVCIESIGRFISDCGKYVLLPNLPTSKSLKIVYKSYLKEEEPAGFDEETTFEYNIVRYSREGRHAYFWTKAKSMANEARKKSGEEVATSDESLGRSRAAADRRVHSDKDSNERAPLQVGGSQVKPLLEKPVPNAEHQQLGRRARQHNGEDKSSSITKRPKIIPVATSSVSSDLAWAGRTNPEATSSGATRSESTGKGRTNPEATRYQEVFEVEDMGFDIDGIEGSQFENFGPQPQTLVQAVGSVYDPSTATSGSAVLHNMTAKPAVVQAYSTSSLGPSSVVTSETLQMSNIRSVEVKTLQAQYDSINSQLISIKSLLEGVPQQIAAAVGENDRRWAKIVGKVFDMKMKNFVRTSALPTETAGCQPMPSPSTNVSGASTSQHNMWEVHRRKLPFTLPLRTKNALLKAEIHLGADEVEQKIFKDLTSFLMCVVLANNTPEKKEKRETLIPFVIANALFGRFDLCPILSMSQTGTSVTVSDEQLVSPFLSTEGNSEMEHCLNLKIHGKRCLHVYTQTVSHCYEKNLFEKDLHTKAIIAANASNQNPPERPRLTSADVYKYLSDFIRGSRTKAKSDMAAVLADNGQPCLASTVKRIQDWGWFLMKELKEEYFMYCKQNLVVAAKKILHEAMRNPDWAKRSTTPIDDCPAESTNNGGIQTVAGANGESSDNESEYNSPVASPLEHFSSNDEDSSDPEED